MKHGLMTHLAAAGLLAAAMSCRTTPDEGAGSADVLYHHNWWNYYARGSARLARGDYAAARADFESALGLRPGARFGYPRDMWRARTYGLHFVEGYFPHRELGVCLYHLDETPAAIRYLELSLEQEPSGRARHYLNLARARQVTAAGAPPPAIRFDPDTGGYTRLRTCHLSGAVAAEGYVRAVTIAGRPEFIELASRDFPLRAAVPLRAGTNRITVAATDLAGQQTARDWLVIADWRPPELLIRDVRRVRGHWIAAAVCVDDHLLAQVKVDGRDRLGRADQSRLELDLELDADRPALVEARAAAGNVFRTLVAANELATLAARPALDAYAVAAAGTPDVPAAPKPTADRLKPALTLNSEVFSVVFDEEFYLDGVAGDGGGLGAITVNGEDVLQPDERGARQKRFARRIPLDAGTNELVVAAADVAGNTIAKRLVVVRRAPEYLDEEYRLRLGVPPPANAPDTALAGLIRNGLEVEIMRAPARFRLLERDAAGWGLILREQELSLSDLADRDAALRVGKMLPAELVLLTTVLANGGGLTLVARVVDTADGRRLWTGDVYTETMGAALDYQVGGLVLKIEQAFPLVAARIASVGDGTAVIDAGADSGVRAGTRFLIRPVGEDGAAPSSGTILKCGATPVELKIERVQNASGEGIIQPAGATEQIKAGDLVYAR